MSKKKEEREIEIEIPLDFFKKLDNWGWASVILVILTIISILTKGFRVFG